MPIDRSIIDKQFEVESQSETAGALNSLLGGLEQGLTASQVISGIQQKRRLARSADQLAQSPAFQARMEGIGIDGNLAAQLIKSNPANFISLMQTALSQEDSGVSDSLQFRMKQAAEKKEQGLKELEGQVLAKETEEDRGLAGTILNPLGSREDAIAFLQKKGITNPEQQARFKKVLDETFPIQEQSQTGEGLKTDLGLPTFDSQGNERKLPAVTRGGAKQRRLQDKTLEVDQSLTDIDKELEDIRKRISGRK